MSVLIAFAALTGVLLGQFFKVFILFPAGILSIIVILAASEDLDGGHGWPIKKIMISITSMEVGFFLGQTAFCIPYFLRLPHAYRMWLVAYAKFSGVISGRLVQKYPRK